MVRTALTRRERTGLAATSRAMFPPILWPMRIMFLLIGENFVLVFKKAIHSKARAKSVRVS